MHIHVYCFQSFTFMEIGKFHCVSVLAVNKRFCSVQIVGYSLRPSMVPSGYFGCVHCPVLLTLYTCGKMEEELKLTKEWKISALPGFVCVLYAKQKQLTFYHMCLPADI